MRNLEYRIVQDRDGQPLVVLESPLGNGQELSSDALRRLAVRLTDIADMAQQSGQGKSFRPQKGSIEY